MMGLKCTAGFVLILTFTAYPASDPIIHTEYVTEGDAATLRCDHAEKSGSCFTTVWFYNGYNAQNTYELVTDGKINNPKAHVRVTLLPNCSPHISNIITEDAGIYTCRQLINGDQHGDDARVYVSVVKMLVTKIKMGVKLHCSLYNYHARGDCNRRPFDKVDLRWLDDTGAQLREDTKHQIQTSSCDSNLTVKSDDTDIGRRFTCQLRDGGEEKISVSYSVPNQENRKSHSGGARSEVNAEGHENVSPTKAVEEDKDTQQLALTVRLTLFFLVLILPLIIGGVYYTRRRNNTQTDNVSTDVQLAVLG